MRITKKELEKMYKENLSKDVCTMLGITSATLRKYLKEAGIRLKGSGNNPKKRKITIV
jgi:predicted nucleic acid-binding Zn ribbon protein